MRSIIAGAACLIATTGLAFADEHLEFKTVFTPVEVTVQQAPNVEGQVMRLAKNFGVAYFTDGRIAAQNFVVGSDVNNKSDEWIYHGFSTFTFEDGSSLTASFLGKGDAKGTFSKGEYKILSGTGRYADATGTGSFEKLPAKFKEFFFSGRFDIKTTASQASK
jgi:hypothetical protein